MVATYSARARLSSSEHERGCPLVRSGTVLVPNGPEETAPEAAWEQGNAAGHGLAPS